MTDYVGIMREHDGKLSPHWILSRPLGDHIDPIVGEVAERMIECFPDREVIEQAAYFANSDDTIGLLAYTLVSQWYDRGVEFISRYPHNGYCDQIRDMAGDLETWI